MLPGLKLKKDKSLFTVNKHKHKQKYKEKYKQKYKYNYSHSTMSETMNVINLGNYLTITFLLFLKCRGEAKLQLRKILNQFHF